MLAKLQYTVTDTNCLQTLSSTRTTTSNVGISLPAVKKQSDHFEHQRHKQVLQTPNGGQLARKSAVVEGRRTGTEKHDKFNGGFGARSSSFSGENGGPGNEEKTSDSLFGGADGEDQRIVDFEPSLSSAGEMNGGLDELCARISSNEDDENLVHKSKKGKKDFYVRKPVHTVEKSGRVRNRIRSSSTAVEMKTKCSTKWGIYGGCIPAMLESVDTINDLDEALKPWEMSLTNKERSILLKEQTRWERAMEIFGWFKRKGCYEVNVIHYNIMLRILGKAQQWCEVERLCDEMGKRGIKLINSTYGTLIDVYSKGGLMDQATKWLELMNKHQMVPDEVTMGTVLQMYKKAGDFDSAEMFFKKWSCSNFVVGYGNATTRIKMGINGDYPSKGCLSTYTYNTLIDTFGKAGKLQEACETFERMIQKGIVPTTVTYNTIIHMYGNNGQLDKVVSLIQRMDEAKCCPDTRTYNILIFLHAKHNDIKSAARYLKKMKEASLEPDAVSYRTLLYALSTRHMVAEAEELIVEMDDRGVEIDEFTQSSLTRMYIEAGMIERSWSWFQRFHISGNMTSECYSATIDAYGERGYIFEAQKVFNCCLQVKKMTVLGFNVIVKAYGVVEKFDQACCLFDRMEKQGLYPDRCGYNSLIQMLASADLPEKATYYLRKMQEAGLVIDCIPYCAVISSYVRLGQMDMAVALYNEMIGYGITPDVVVYGVLINGFAETGSVREAAYYVDTMSKMGLPINAVVCKSLIKLYTKAGYLKEAEEAYNKLQSFEPGIDLYSSNCMIDLYSERSMVTQAEKIFENLKRNGFANEFSYAMMLCMHRRDGRMAEAFRIARKMREQGLMKQLLSYNHVLGLYASNGRHKEAVSTFRDMLRSFIHPDDSTFKSLSIILLRCGVPKYAIDKLELRRKEDSEIGLEAWASTLYSFVDIGDDSYVTK